VLLKSVVDEVYEAILASANTAEASAADAATRNVIPVQRIRARSSH
jgi:hypothetical protein